MVKKDHIKSSDTVMGIDYGERNIGLSIGKKGFVNPLKIIDGKNSNTAIHEIIRIGIENRISFFVIGLPLDAEGKETVKSLKVRQFANLLKLLSKKQVFLQNEHGSSIEATKEAISMGYSQKSRRDTDHLAAALILKNYFGEN